MSDTQRQVKMVTEQALANLVERARRLQLSSVSIVPAIEDSQLIVEEKPEMVPDLTAVGEPELDLELAPSGIGLKKTKTNLVGANSQRSVGSVGRKLRRLETEPTPPPPSPRELCMMAELRDEYIETDRLVDEMLTDATSLNQDVVNCRQHQRDLSLVQEIELEATTRILDSFFEELRLEIEGDELSGIIRRCCSVLDRTKEQDDHAQICFATEMESLALKLENPETNDNDAAEPDDNVEPMADDPNDTTPSPVEAQVD